MILSIETPQEVLLLRRLERSVSAHLINPHDPGHLDAVRETLLELKELRKKGHT